MSPFEIEARALQLPLAERAELARVLLNSLDEDSDIEAAWMEEAARRGEEIKKGAVPTIPAADVFAEARARQRGRDEE